MNSNSNLPLAEKVISTKAPIADIHDRVTEAYYGKLGEQFMRETQTRINWICNNIKGRDVLDVGCSQGIVPILLAREGIKVIGVDTSICAIDEAKQYLAVEPSHVQDKITFINADFLSHDFNQPKIETVIITEVLEHLVQPQTFIEAAAKLLPNDGRLIINVPFGINDFIDHKHTFYLLEPYRLIASHFEINEVTVLGKWLGIVASRNKVAKSKSVSSLLSIEQIEKLEAAFFQIERNLRDDLVSTKKKLDDANLKYRASTEQIATLKQRVSQIDIEYKQAVQSSEQLKAQLILVNQQLELENQTGKMKTERLEMSLEGQREARHDAELRLVRLEANLEAVTTRIDEANRRIHTDEENIAELEAKLLAMQTEADTAAKKLLDYEEQGRVKDQAINTQQEQLTAVQEEYLVRYNELQLHIDEANRRIHTDEENIAELEAKLLAMQTEAETAAKKLLDYEEQGRVKDQTIHTQQEQLTAVQEEYLARYNELQLHIDEANRRIHTDEENIVELEAKLLAMQTEAETAAKKLLDYEEQGRVKDQTIHTQQEQLTAVQEEYLSSKTKLECAESVLETTRALQRNEQHQSEQLKLQVLQAKKALTDVQAQMESLRQQKVAAENQVIKTRNMISFQLGQTLLNGIKSWRGIITLPGKLLAIDREAKRRKVAKGNSIVQFENANVTFSNKNIIRSPTVTSLLRDTSRLFLPEGNFSQTLKTLKVACIMDEFTFSSYQPECNLLQLSVTHWQTELETFTPELLFIESAWRGKDEQWGSKVGYKSEEVVGVVEWCRQRKIPTVFWNKEDPVHFETFLNTAKMFDYVFTTDIDCISRYKAALGHEHVYLLQFACQPEDCNPIETYQRKDAFCFAGSYYVRYPERTRDLGNIITALAEYRPIEIYDRNFGKDNPSYQFPPEYQPFIVGNLPFDQIDKAYKGYRYGINLNSIKQSQSMFARRVFDLLASNTVTVSNFSRGVRLLFGDLVITTDSGGEMVRRLQTLGSDDVLVRKFRLAGLRKVMMEHTYQDRLAYVVSKAQGKANPSLLPSVLITAYAKNQNQLDTLLANFNRQSYSNCRFILVVPNGFTPNDVTVDTRVQVLPANTIDELKLGDLTADSELISAMVPDDYYGPNYLLDLILATRYSTAHAFGKGSHYAWSTSKGLNLVSPSHQYMEAKKLNVRSSLVRSAYVSDIPLRDWVISLFTRQVEVSEMLAIDEFNYCKNANSAGFDATQAETVNDLVGLDYGLTAEELVLRAENVKNDENYLETPDDVALISGDKLASYFSKPSNKAYSLKTIDSVLEIESTLDGGKHENLYATAMLKPEDLGFKQHAKFYLDTSDGLNLQLIILFLNADKQRFAHAIKPANINQEVAIPAGAEWIRLGFRISGSGKAQINALELDHRPFHPAEVLGRAEHLVLTKQYPSYDDLYRYGFVHSRVAAYAESGVRVDVFRLLNGGGISFHEFVNIDVITGSQKELHKLLASGRYKSVLVHFLDEDLWQVLQHHIHQIKIFVWVHGAEIQPWHRRDYNFTNDIQRQSAKAQSEVRMAFWRGLLTKIPENLKLIFVSKYFAEEVMEDLGFRLPDASYNIIHNPIDTDLFAYNPKPSEQRKKVLSIRPYASRKYANDLSVAAILALSKKPFFKDMEFRIIGDGKLFDEVLEPLRGFNNVYIERRFVTHTEMAELHREYGIFLSPTRMDAQGVSRDEAMSSGLVPVTNGVTAIPEFVDESCGILAPGDDAMAMAEGIECLYLNSDLFTSMSAAAAQRVRQQSAKEVLIKAELNLFNSDSKA